GENAVLLEQLRVGDLDIVVGRLAGAENMAGFSLRKSSIARGMMRDDTVGSEPIRIGGASENCYCETESRTWRNAVSA
ncbi:hypothetical protein ACC687_42505, partial [Rhizobium ruizarguesonis]